MAKSKHTGSSTLRQYNVRFPDDLRENFHNECRQQRLIPAEVIRDLVAKFVERGANQPRNT